MFTDAMDSELYLGKLNHCWEDHCRDMVCTLFCSSNINKIIILTGLVNLLLTLALPRMYIPNSIKVALAISHCQFGI